MSLPVIIIGAGGHAKVLLDALLSRGREVIGMTEIDHQRHGLKIYGIPVIGDDNRVQDYSPQSVELVVGLGSVRATDKRRCLFEEFRTLGYRFATVVHESAVLSPRAILAEGVQALAGTVVQPGCRIGMNVILNTRASIDHDCVIGDHVHIAPGVILSGEIQVGSLTHIGTAATVIQGVTIGRRVTVGAGAVVISDLPDGVTAVGVPARVIKL